ncbi:MAG TPA: hypothetical protein VES97_03920 [Solirubrobacteraceae bacterium]|nr:hypothetical protein [Solirubrobacteraceae bacterium]
MASPALESTRRRAAACSACVALVLALACSIAPAAFSAKSGEGSAFGELTKGQSETTTPTPAPATPTKGRTTTNEVTTEATNSRTLIILGIVAAVLLLSAIVFVIARDARRMAPAGDPDLIERSSAREQAVKLQKRRAKAKAARRQRRRNR